MKRIVIALILVSTTIVTISSCTKDPLNDMSYEDSRVYITQKSDSADFSSYSTFYIADSVAVINGNASKKSYNSVDSAYIAATVKYLTAAGYTRTMDTANADLGVTVNKIISYSTGYYNYGGYWGGFGGFWDPGFYWGYPGYGYGYPGFVQPFVIQDVAMEIDLLDLKNATTNKNIKLIWMGAINGAGVANNDNPSIADSQVASLFAQSTYLKK
ncbi:MAG: DUF4136 domain-containing protein [Pseudopedobacter saltans]|uniref:DUF4136 domain-containing protein n=1 Tax=Pseudopedobacter saltans TaxID=151895 RepID=A0A2W5F2B7_9SPHI|nr:MAG: DUF4136 domain-containing protein [Pseudopedobacter saltans]